MQALTRHLKHDMSTLTLFLITHYDCYLTTATFKAQQTQRS